MRIVVDLTDGASFPNGDELPPSVILDDGDVVVVFGDAEIRMTNAQFDRFLDAMNAWMSSLPAMDERDI